VKLRLSNVGGNSMLKCDSKTIGNVNNLIITINKLTVEISSVAEDLELEIKDSGSNVTKFRRLYRDILASRDVYGGRPPKGAITGCTYRSKKRLKKISSHRKGSGAYSPILGGDLRPMKKTPEQNPSRGSTDLAKRDQWTRRLKKRRRVGRGVQALQTAVESRRTSPFTFPKKDQLLYSTKIKDLASETPNKSNGGDFLLNSLKKNVSGSLKEQIPRKSLKKYSTYNMSTKKGSRVTPKKLNYMYKSQSSSSSKFNWSHWSRCPKDSFSAGEMTGFKNLGNTCYMNAVLQALLGLKPFTSDLTNVSANVVPKKSFMEEMLTLYREKKKQQENRKGPVDIKKLKAAIGARYRRFAGNSQQDAHEFLSECLNQIDQDLLDGLGNNPENNTPMKESDLGSKPSDDDPPSSTTAATLGDNDGNTKIGTTSSSIETNQPEIVAAAVPEEKEWSCQACTFLNASNLSSCMVCRTARRPSRINDEEKIVNSMERRKKEIKQAKAISSKAPIEKILKISPIQRNFRFRVTSRLKCTSLSCGYTREITEEFNDMSLDLLLKNNFGEIENEKGGRKSFARDPRVSFHDRGGSSQITDENAAFESSFPNCKKCGRSMARKFGRNGSCYYKCQGCQATQSATTTQRAAFPTNTTTTTQVQRRKKVSEFTPKTSDLKDLLQKFFATTIVEYKCDKCSNAKAHVTSSFASLPNILVLHLKRFRPNFVKRTYEKKTDRIRISQTLNLPDDAGSAKNLKDWSCQKCTFKNAGTIPKCQICNTEKPSTIYNENATKDEDIAKDSCLSIKNQSGVAKQLATSKYDLQAAVLHQGTTAEAGHYVTHVKDGKKWKRYNDSHVSAIDDSSSRKKVDNEGYLLFYVKR